MKITRHFSQFTALKRPCFCEKCTKKLLLCFLYSHGHSHSRADHGVVAHADQAHHFHVSRNGGRTGELSVRVHTAHGVGHAVRGGAGGHVVGMQGTAGAAAGSHGEVLLAGFPAFLLVGARHGVLEAGRVGGVAGDGNVHALVPHDGNALAHIVRAVAANLGALTVGVLGLVDDGQSVIFLHVGRQVVILGLHIGEAVDAADDHGGVLAQTVQDDAQGSLANLVGVADDADGAFGGGEGLVAGQEREALGLLAQYGIGSVEECRDICKARGFDPYEIVKEIQPICFENACWAYTVGAAIALKSGVKTAAEAAKMIGVGLQSFCIDGSVADDRKVGLGHGNLGAMLLSDESKCFAFLAGHESFAAAEGAIGIVKNANKARKQPLRVILNGLGKDAAQIISRINGFTYVQTQFDYYTSQLKVVREIRYSEGERADVRCYGADDVREGVAIMHHEGVDVSITGNSTNPTRFQHPVAGTYKKECIEQGKKYFSVASGGGTGRTLHPDNMAAGPASYGMTDTMGRMHSDAQFAGSSSVPAHVEMMGFLGMGNNPMVGATVAVAVAVEQSLKN